MKRPIPLVHEFMSPAPQTIQAHKTVGVAKQMMSELGVRHLPVIFTAVDAMHALLELLGQLQE
jgi:hypothetical protein